MRLELNGENFYLGNLGWVSENTFIVADWTIQEQLNGLAGMPNDRNARDKWLTNLMKFGR